MTASPVCQAAVFVDRDGTLIAERHYLAEPEQVELLPGAAAGVRRMNAKGFKVVVVTNQSGVGRGYFTAEQMQAVHQRMQQLLAAEGAAIDAIYFCPHVPEDDCACRKPRAGMIESAVADLHLDPRQSYVIGDKPCDVDLGKSAGARSILVRTGYGGQYERDPDCQPDVVCDSLEDAAEWIEQQGKASRG